MSDGNSASRAFPVTVKVIWKENDIDPSPIALAIRFEQLIREGTVKDQADLARLAHISRARVTQIMDLLLLAPEIQEEILFLSLVERGKDRITERELRPILAMVDWQVQRRAWANNSSDSLIG